jgi:hypothetical protein
MTDMFQINDLVLVLAIDKYRVRKVIGSSPYNLQ